MEKFYCLITNFDYRFMGIGENNEKAFEDAVENEYEGDPADLLYYSVSKTVYDLIVNNCLCDMEKEYDNGDYAIYVSEDLYGNKYKFYLFKGEYLVTEDETEKCFSKKNSFSIDDYDDFISTLNHYDKKGAYWCLDCPGFHEENFYSGEELLNLVTNQDIKYWLHEGAIIRLNSYVENRKIKNI